MRRTTALLLGLDLCIVAMATLLAFMLRDTPVVFAERWNEWGLYIAITVFCSLVVFVAAGIHRSVYRFANLNDYLWLSSLTVIIVLMSVISGFLINRLDGIARTLPVLQVILVVSLLVIARVAYRLFHARRTADQEAGHWVDDIDTVLVVGVNPVSDLFLRSVDDLGQGRIRIAGVLANNQQNLRGRRMGTHRVLGGFSDIDAILNQQKVHGITITRIVVTVAEDSLSDILRSSLEQLQALHGLEIDFFADKIGLGSARRKRLADASVHSDTDEALLALSLAGPLSFGQRGFRVLKRLIDLSASTLLLVVLWPMIMIVALIVWRDVGQPLLFWQQRPGRGGRPIRVFKFRTMGNAHTADGTRLPDAKRLSPIGNMLRQRRLDELPQLFNILVGDMSFVGPRPLLPVDQPSDVRARLNAKPGLTGWAQVMGGRHVTPEDKAALDQWYVDNVSLKLDIEILFRTVPVILFGEKVNAAAIRKACDAIGRLPDCMEARAIPASGIPASQPAARTMGDSITTPAASEARSEAIGS